MRKYLAVLMLLAVAGCSGEKAPGPVVMDSEETERWEIDLVEMRIEKNEAFMDSLQSPLMVEDMADFEGLNYFYPEPELRFQVPFQAEAGSDTIVMTKRRGEQVPYLRKGRVTFAAVDGTVTLSVFGSTDEAYADDLWLPFYDSTSGTETYGGGRYLDLELAEDGTIIVDFNYAYNPLCDYNPERFNCMRPPEENTVSFAIKAGEMLLHGPEHERGH